MKHVLSLPALAASLMSVLAVVTTTHPSPAASQPALPDHARVTAALREVVAQPNGGFGLQMWATLVERDGVVQGVGGGAGRMGGTWLGRAVGSGVVWTV